MKNATNLKAAEDVPGKHAVGGLAVDDVRRLRTRRAGLRPPAKGQGQLIADDLGAGAQRSQQRIFIVRRPARERDPVDADRRDAEDDQQADLTSAIWNRSTPCQVMLRRRRESRKSRAARKPRAMMGARIYSGR